MKNILNNRSLLMILAAVLAVVLVAGLAAVVIINAVPLKITLIGSSIITLEAGESGDYIDDGAQATLNGKVHTVTVTGADTVNTQKLGTYTVTYTAQHLWRKLSAVRTVHVVDTQAPLITLLETDGYVTMPGEEYEEEGFVAEDSFDGDLTDKVVRTVDGDKVVYTVTDSAGNTTTVERIIEYGDDQAPVVTLLGEQTITIQAGQKFEDPGVTAVDNVDGDITDKVTVSGDHNIYKAGTYTITYTVTDNFGNIGTVTRTLVVKAKDQQQVVTPEGATIYLTFDDGPSQYTRKLLDVLKEYGVKATFFVKNNPAYLHLLKDIVDEGHSIAIHTTTHDYAEIYASEDAFLKDLTTMGDIIYEYTGVRTTLMRFPGGSSNAVSKKYNEGIMTRLTKIVQDMGYQYFDWNVDSDDAGDAKTADEVVYNVIHGKNNTWRGCEDGKISIVLQHDIKGYSVDAVAQIIEWGLANGYTFAALDATSPTCHHSVNN